MAPPLHAQDRLIDQEPYDQITLDARNNHAVRKVQPLRLPTSRLPQKPKAADKLVVHLLDEPETAYELSWKSVAKIERFEDLVLAEAEALLRAGKLDAAYDNLRFLEVGHPRTAGLAAAFDQYLFEEAKAAHLRKQYDVALATLRELYGRNPQRAGLDAALGATTDKLVEQYLAKEDYRAARALLQNLAAWFPEQPVVAARQGQLIERATVLLAEARTAAEAEQFPKAYQVMARLGEAWPDLPGAKELAQSIHEEYPRIVVGVSRMAGRIAPGRLDDWAARRSSRLVYRTLTEFTGAGTEGGRYLCPVGELSVGGLEPRLVLRLRPNLRWLRGDTVLTGYDVSRLLLAMADPADPAYRTDWAGLLGSVSVRDVYQVDVEFRRLHLRPDALLQVIPRPATVSGESAEPPGNGPYVIQSRSTAEITYTASHPPLPAGGARGRGLREITERHCPRGERAIESLRRGQIQVLDRISPWGLEVLRADHDLVVEQYGVPLVHCLIPNVAKPLLSQRTFRRALVYGIDREAILKHLVADAKLPGCQVISGPFPLGLSFDDPIRYAYDTRIAPRAYDPRLAAALAGAAVKELNAAREKEKVEPLGQAPPLVLAFPGEEIARAACESIQRQLKLIGLPIELRELKEDLPQRVPAEIDLLYVELAVWEPLVDARRVLGEEGPAGACSPYMALALRQLDQATDWEQAQAVLRRIHRLAHDEAAVVPLWQLTDFFAYRKSASGIGNSPVTLYQHVEEWQRAFEYLAEGPQPPRAVGERD